MIKKLKERIIEVKGVNLISLTIAVTVILILTGIIIVNSTSSLKSNKLRNMQADIDNLRDKISNYYSQYGEIPADRSIEYTNINNINSISSATDTGVFYVIDLAAMENITLNYGKDYEKIRNGEATTEEEINKLTDLYIINADSHNIFYVEGIELDGETFYTDYVEEDKDTEFVDLRYVENVEIPDGFYYVGGTKEEGIVISDVAGDDLENSKGGNQFVWVPVEDETDYVRNISYQVVGVSETAYTDTGYLPEGIQPGEDNSEQNEKAEKQAVIDAGGFFISRFEAGKETINGEDKLVSKKGATVWGDTVSQENAKKISKTFINNNSVKSALISGIQWDALMGFINGKTYGNGDIVYVTGFNQSVINTTKSKTGLNKKDVVCNIYDLAGNYVEYIAEIHSYNNNIKIYRGGAYRTKNPISYRGYSAPHELGSEAHTFRFILYVIPRDNWTPTYDKQTIYTDKNGDTATIPKGFSVSRKPNEKTIANGLVVKAPDGSEFIWVPVEDINSMAQCSTAGGDCNLLLQNDGTLKCVTHNSTEIVGKLYAIETGENFGTVNTTYNPKDGLREPAVVIGNGSEYDAQYYSNAGFSSLSDMENGLKQEYNNMATSVAKYKGFYVGRYESSLSTATETENGSGGTIQSKKGVMPISADTETTNMWYGLYKIQKEYSDSEKLKVSNIGSSMIWGSQYDAIINWAKNGKDATKLIDKHLGNSMLGIYTYTGNDKFSNDRVNNIYDLQGNRYEYTLECGVDDNHYSSVRIARGSTYSFERDYTLMHRIILEVTQGYADQGSRLTLYIK